MSEARWSNRECEECGLLMATDGEKYWCFTMWCKSCNKVIDDKTIYTHPEEFEERTDKLLDKMDTLLNKLDEE